MTWRSLVTSLLKGIALLVSVLLLLACFASDINPENLPYVSFLGLALPYLIYTNLFFVAIFLVLRKAWIVIPIVSLLLALPAIFNYLQFNPSKNLKSHTTAFKVMSYNVRLFDLYNWSNNKTTRNQIFSFLKKEEPAIVCFQEFYHVEKSGFFDTRDSLIKLLDAKHVHEGYTHHLKHDQHFGLATFSQFPIINSGEIDFDNDPNNNAIYTDLKIEDDTLRVYNAHLASIRFQKADYAAVGDNMGEEIYKRSKETSRDQQILERLKQAFIKRSRQSRILVEHIQQSPYPVVLCGDFNDTPNSYCYQRFNEFLEDAFKVSGKGTSGTYIGQFPSYRIDYIFHDSQIQSGNYLKHQEKLSDHHAISCWLEL